MKADDMCNPYILSGLEFFREGGFITLKLLNNLASDNKKICQLTLKVVFWVENIFLAVMDHQIEVLVIFLQIQMYSKSELMNILMLPHFSKCQLILFVN